MAQGILAFVSIFTAPVGSWVTRNDFRTLGSSTTTFGGFPFQDALPRAAEFLLILLVWYVLFRWLYFKPWPSPDADSE
jgi:hypothetical protein